MWAREDPAQIANAPGGASLRLAIYLRLYIFCFKHVCILSGMRVSPIIVSSSIFLFVGKRGLEPPRIAPQPPQGCVYANFTTCPPWLSETLPPLGRENQEGY